MRAPTFSPRKQGAFTYAEVLLSVTLVVILLVPALRSLQTAIAGGAMATGDSQLDLRSKMEAVLASPFDKLYAETYVVGANTTSSISGVFSDPPPGKGVTTARRMVVLYRYDASANALSAADTGLVFVSVFYEGDSGAGALNTLAGRWW